MDELLKNAASPSSWLGVVVVGIVVGVIANFLWLLINILFAKYSTRWRQRVERRHRERQERVQKLRDNKEQQIREELRQIMSFISAGLGALVAIIFWLTGLILDEITGFQIFNIFLFVIAFVFLLKAFLTHRQLRNRRGELVESYSKITEADQLETAE